MIPDIIMYYAPETGEVVFFVEGRTPVPEENFRRIGRADFGLTVEIGSGQQPQNEIEPA